MSSSMGPSSLRRGGGLVIAATFAVLALAAPSALAAVSYQGGSAAAPTKNRTNLTLSKPSTVGQGDLLTAVVEAASSSTSITAPTGWTRRSEGSAGADAKVATYTRVAGASEPSSYSWSFSASGKHAGALAEYAGVDTASPVDAVLGQSNDPSSPMKCPSVTASVANAMLVCLVGQPNGSLFTYPPGMTLRQQARTGSAGTDRAVGIGDEPLPTSGVTGERVVKDTSGSPADASVGVSMLLRPAPQTPPPPPPSSVFFTGDFETGDLSQWSAVQKVAADRILVGQDFVRQGSYSARFTVKPGDCWKNASGTCSDRAEVHTNTNGQLHFTEGQDRYLGWSTRFNPAWPTSSHWAIFLQLHSGSGSPPVAMELTTTGSTCASTTVPSTPRARACRSSGMGSGTTSSCTSSSRAIPQSASPRRGTTE